MRNFQSLIQQLIHNGVNPTNTQKPKESNALADNDGNASFSETVTAKAFKGDGSQLDNLPDSGIAVNDGVFTGTLTGNDTDGGGTIELNADTGTILSTAITLSGDISAVGGTFSGELVGTTLELTDTLTGTDATFSGTVTATTFSGDGSQLTGLNATTISESAPSNPNAGDLWWDSVNGILYVYYSDAGIEGNDDFEASSQWVDTRPAAGDIGGDVDPDVDGTRNLGSFAKTWNEVHANIIKNATRVTIDDVLNVKQTPSLPANPVSGDIVNHAGVLKFHNGTTWKTFTMA